MASIIIYTYAGEQPAAALAASIKCSGMRSLFPKESTIFKHKIGVFSGAALSDNDRGHALSHRGGRVGHQAHDLRKAGSIGEPSEGLARGDGNKHGL